MILNVQMHVDIGIAERLFLRLTKGPTKHTELSFEMEGLGHLMTLWQVDMDPDVGIRQMLRILKRCPHYKKYKSIVSADATAGRIRAPNATTCTHRMN